MLWTNNKNVKIKIFDGINTYDIVWYRLVNRTQCCNHLLTRRKIIDILATRLVFGNHLVYLKHNIEFASLADKFSDSPEQLEMPKVQQIENAKCNGRLAIIIAHFCTASIIAL